MRYLWCRSVPCRRDGTSDEGHAGSVTAQGTVSGTNAVFLLPALTLTSNHSTVSAPVFR